MELCKNILYLQCSVFNKISGKEDFQNNNNKNNLNNNLNNSNNNLNNSNNNLNNLNKNNNLNNSNNNLNNNNKKFLGQIFIISVILVLIGLCLTILALFYAFKCNKMDTLIIVHVFLAFWMPPIYLLYILLSGCNNKNNFKNNNNRN